MKYSLFRPQKTDIEFGSWIAVGDQMYIHSTPNNYEDLGANGLFTLSPTYLSTSPVR